MKPIFLLALISILSIGAAYSTTITIVPVASVAAAESQESAWLAANFPANSTIVTTETFESFNYGPWNQLATGTGTFVAVPGGLPSDMSGTHTDQFTILNSSDTPFSGRYNTTDGGQNWLDSNDITLLQLNTQLSNLYFVMNDVNDTGGALQIKTQDGTTSSAFLPTAQNGQLYFIGITSSGPIGSIEWINNIQHDGFGLDDFGTITQPSQVPEPANVLTGASGLLILLGAVRLRSRMGSSAPSTSATRRSRARQE